MLPLFVWRFIARRSKLFIWLSTIALSIVFYVGITMLAMRLISLL